MERPYVFLNTALVMSDLGEPAEALAHAQVALEIFKAIGRFESAKG
jgi:hypothetical protein